MRSVIVTTAGDPMGGVFARSYLQSGGTSPEAIVVLPDRKELGFPLWAKPLVGLRLLGLRGSARVFFARKIGWSPWGKDIVRGLGGRWPHDIAGPETVLHGTESLRQAEILAVVRKISPDILISVGAPVIFGGRILAECRVGAINVHNGRLPFYRGHFGTFWELQRGESESWVSIHEMAEKVDTGKMLDAASLRTRDFHSFLDLLIAKKEVGGRLLSVLIREVTTRGSFDGTPISVSEPTSYFGWPSLSEIFRFRYPASAQGGGD